MRLVLLDRPCRRPRKDTCSVWYSRRVWHRCPLLSLFLTLTHAHTHTRTHTSLPLTRANTHTQTSVTNSCSHTHVRALEGLVYLYVSTLSIQPSIIHIIFQKENKGEYKRKKVQSPTFSSPIHIRKCSLEEGACWSPDFASSSLQIFSYFKNLLILKNHFKAFNWNCCAFSIFVDIRATIQKDI